MRTTLCGAAFAAAFALALPLAAHAESLRPAVGKPLEKATAYLRAHKYSAAMAEVHDAERAPGLSADERFVIEEMRGSIAQAEGDNELAAKTFAQLLASGRVPASEQVRLIQAEISITYAQKNYAGTIEWLNKYFKAGGTSPEMHALLIGTYYANKDYAEAAKLEAAAVAAEVRAHKVPTEAQLDLMAAAYRETGEAAGFKSTMINLAYYYPKPDYWENLIALAQAKRSFSDRLTLDLDRFKMQIGLITTADQYMEMAELSLEVPLPGEAKALVDKAYAAGVFGTGAQASREKRLQDLVEKVYARELPQLPGRVAAAQSAHDGNALDLIGEEYCSYGQYDKGIPLIVAAIAKGGLRHPDDTQLHLALAYDHAGNKAEALTALGKVGGTEGAADIAELWSLVLGH